MKRSRAEKNTQLRNTLAASAASLFAAVIITLIARLCFKATPVILILIALTSFALTLGLLILLWKKTDLMRKMLYCLYRIKHPENTMEYFCPCCNRNLARFADMKYYEDHERYDPSRFKSERQDVICPFCYSAPRQRILASWADKNKSLLEGSKILYFAPEYSMMKWFKRNRITPTTADLYAPGVDLKLDLTNIDLPDGSYDMVICNHVLEHVPGYEKALSELNRVLRQNGTLIISFPIDQNLDNVNEQETKTPEERIKAFGQYDHIRLFGKNSKEIISSFGFDVSVIDTSDMPQSILPVTGPADYDSNCIFLCVRGDD